MKTFTLSTTLAIFAAAAVATAAALPAQVESRVFNAALSFRGVDPEQSYFVSAPVNDQVFLISMLSILFLTLAKRTVIQIGHAGFWAGNRMVKLTTYSNSKFLECLSDQLRWWRHL